MKRDSNTGGTESHSLFEQLEQRMLLAFDPATFPALGDLVGSTNTVIRMETDLGTIDIELFDRLGPDGETASAAKATVDHFLNVIAQGGYDDWFFHRLVEGFVLQGGGFVFDDDTGLGETPDVDTVDNQFDPVRSNVERTIALAKLGGDPDSATNQFFFNLDDNSQNLDNQNGGFTVFGRVADDASWDTVLAIAGLDTASFSDSGQPGGDPLSGALTDTPVTEDPGAPAESQLPSDLLTDELLVEVTDVEVIKAFGSTRFFTRALYFPDGYADAGKIVNTLELGNPAPNETIRYQVILRFETGFRDQVVATGTLTGGQTTTEVISDFADIDATITRTGAPFAIEVQSDGSSRPLIGTIIREDLGAKVAEALTDEGFQRWTFAGARKDTGTGGSNGPSNVVSFVTFQNTTAEEATVSVQFFDPNGGGVDANVVMTLGGNRRGGLNIAQLPGVPAGDLGIRVNSTQPLVAAYTEFENSSFNDGASALMVPGDGGETGILPVGRISSGSNTTVTRLGFLNTSDAAEVVQLSFILNDGTIIPDSVTVPPQSVGIFDLSTLLPAIPAADRFTVRYDTTMGAQVTGHYISTAAQDSVAMPFRTTAAQVHSFAGAFYDPDRVIDVDPDTGDVIQSGSLFEQFTVYNPNSDNPITVVVDVFFSDGTEITGVGFTVDPGDRLDFALDDLDNGAAIVDKISSGPEFFHPTVSILTLDPLNPSSGAGVVGVLTLDTILDFSSASLLFVNGPETSLDDPRFTLGGIQT